MKCFYVLIIAYLLSATVAVHLFPETLDLDEETSEYLEDDILENFKVRSALKDEEYLWPNGFIPYVIDPDYDEQERKILANSMLQFHNKSCVRFVPKTRQDDFVYISKDGGCSSYVGRVSGSQILSLGSGCLYLGIVMHELMHTLGFVHEQNRPDRDDYVEVIWDNVKDSRKGNFLKMDWYNLTDVGESYDYNSILHYNRFAFSKEPGKKPTLKPKKRGVRIGQRKYLSPGDVRKINKLYNCLNEYI